MQQVTLYMLTKFFPMFCVLFNKSHSKCTFDKEWACLGTILYNTFNCCQECNIKMRGFFSELQYKRKRAGWATNKCLISSQPVCHLITIIYDRILKTCSLQTRNQYNMQTGKTPPSPTCNQAALSGLCFSFNIFPFLLGISIYRRVLRFLESLKPASFWDPTFTSVNSEVLTYSLNKY